MSTDKSALSESFAGQYVSMREEDINIYNFATRRDSQETKISINLPGHPYLPITIWHWKNINGNAMFKNVRVSVFNTEEMSG